VHGLIAATGAATKRFDDLAAAMCAASADAFVEMTMPSARVRLGIVGSGAVAVGTTAGSRAAAVLGSAVLATGAPLATQTLERFGSDPATILDHRADDLVAMVADEEAGTMTLGAGGGNHRLFVADVDGGLLVATQLAPLASALGADLALDRSFEDFFLGFGFLPDGRTVYDGIRVMGAGQVLSVPNGAPRAVEPAPLDLPDIDLHDLTAVSNALHDAFIGALEEQAGTRTRHAVLLGGFDSALVAAGLRRLGHEVDCYTFGFDDPTYEQRNADELARAIGAAHTWVRFTPAVIGDLLSRFDQVINQPGAQPHYQLHTVHASCAIAADGHSHVFTGDGCDAVFLGYPTVNRRARMVARLSSIPDPVLRGGTKLLGYPFVERHLGHVSRFTRSMLESLLLDEPARSHLPTRYLDDIALRRLRVDASPPQAETVTETRIRLAAPLAGLDATRRAFQGHALIGQSKAKVEAAVAASGVAQYSPFLHPELKSLAAALPVEVLRPEGSSASSAGKAVLVAMAREHKLVPESIITMPKQSPSDSPIDQWYAGPLRPLVYELVDGLPFAVNRSYVDEILASKRAEDVFRQKASITHHAFQAIGLLCSYGAYARRVR
jgi:asparagine synthase (glutamine-hydrolysing)